MSSRNYIGLSEIGQCMRRTAYRLLGHEENHSQALKYMFAVGHAMEKERISDILLNEGWRVSMKQVEVQCGLAIGHLDGVRSQKQSKIVWECKSSTAGTISTWKVDGLPKRYLYQVNGYMHGLSAKLGMPVESAYLDAGDRSTMSWERFHIQINEEIVEDVKRRASVIKGYVDTGSVPHREFGRRSQECSFCPFFNECWKEEPEPEAAAAKEDEDYDKVARTYKRLKVEEKMNKAGMEELRDTLLEATKMYGGRAETKSGITLVVSQQTRKSLDKAALEKAHPGLLGEFEKTSTNDVLTIKGGDDE